MSNDLPRNSSGRFQAVPDSLHPKTIGLRISKTDYPRFIELAEAMGMRPTELARKAVEEYLERHWNSELMSSNKQPAA